jgi:hypothetical protein
MALSGALAALIALGCGGMVERDRAGNGGGSAAAATGPTGGAGATGGVGELGGTGGLGGADCADLNSNPDHCGTCGHSCLGGQCASGLCQPVVLQYLGNQGATALAVDATHVFWASPVQRTRKNGEQPTTLAEASGSVWGVALDETSIYWTDVYVGLKRMNKDGSGDVASLGKGGYRVAVDRTHVYTAWQSLWKISKADGSIAELAQVGGEGIALDEQFVYVTTWTPGGVWKVAKQGGGAKQLASHEYSAYVAVYGDMVYWTAQGGGSGVYAVSKDTTGVAELLASAATPYGIAADDRGVYWTEFDTGNIWMLPTGSTTPIALATAQHAPRDLTVDEQAVYWTNDASYSAVSRVAKPALSSR